MEAGKGEKKLASERISVGGDDDIAETIVNRAREALRDLSSGRDSPTDFPEEVFFGVRFGCPTNHPERSTLL